MNPLFPLGLPADTTVYLSFYLISLCVHAILMSYVLAGAGYLAARALFGAQARDPLAETLRDWLPFVLSAAITAGIGPLLFVQILYKQSFYTANLLLFWRWTAIVPALMVGFYLLYVAKSERMADWRPAARAAVTGAAFICFVFTGYSWSENHLLALDRSAWVPLYVAGQNIYMDRLLCPRVLLWMTGAFPIMAVVAGWQLRASAARPRNVTIVGLTGVAATAFAGVLFALLLDEPGRRFIAENGGSFYVIAAVTGMVLQAGAWLWQSRTPNLDTRVLLTASVGALLTVVGAAVIRECLRLGRLDVTRLYELHARAAEAGGLPLFALFLLVNSAAITWCVRITRRAVVSRG